MGSTSKHNGIIYRKLVRDKIPEIIREVGKQPFTRKIQGDELKYAIAGKIIEEAYELFKALGKDNKNEVLKESADMLEIVIAALKFHGFTMDDLLSARHEREKQRGAFCKGVFLDSVGKFEFGDMHIQKFPVLFFNPIQKNRLLDLVKSELAQSVKTWIASAFYTPGVSNLLLSDFNQFIENGGELKILLSTMGNITRPEHFAHLQTYVPKLNLKIYHPPEIPFDKPPPNFHLKSYLFRHRNGEGAMVIGSSNFTEAGFTKNIEWNYYSSGEINLPFEGKSPFESAIDEFNRFWNDESVDISDDFLEAYRRRWQDPVNVQKSEFFDPAKPWGVLPEKIVPNDAQKEALDNLSQLRDQQLSKATVIAATGIGKTYLAAFDFKQSGCKRLLFIAHRQNILRKARESFETVLDNKDFGEFLGNGNNVSKSSPGVFAMIQTLSRKAHLKKFSPEEFDYIVVDEFHHGEATTYRKVIDYFKPEFLLGLTATPERMDGRNVLRLCDYNIAYEVRLLEAVDRGWLSPFQYFAVYDETDYEKITWRGTHYDEDELTKALSDDNRTAIVAHNLKKYLPSSGKVRALAFCSSVAHALYTAKRLNDDHHIESVCLFGKLSESEREKAIRRLESAEDVLEVICTVDIFNEGIDIPDLTHVLFLRPTQSFTIFLQQLGRGLRKAESKEYLVVIDFVGNFRKAHVAPLALCGYTSVDQYISELKYFKNGKIIPQLPEGCYLSPEIDVRRIWDREIREIMNRLSPEERLKMLYQDIKQDIGNKPLSLNDMIDNAYDIDPYVFIKQFNGWIRAKLFCGEDLSKYEKSMLDTPGEAFLKYIETDLNPVKSYKMVVLQTLLGLEGTSWKVDEIANGFYNFFLNDRSKLFDYDDLANATEPENFPISRVIRKIKEMPLDKLSNMEKDYFVLDRNSEIFSLKPVIHDFWNNENYKELVKERVDFLLTRYFQRKGLRQIIYYRREIIDEGFKLDQRFAEKFLEDKPLRSNRERNVTIIIDDQKFKTKIRRSEIGKEYRIRYLPDSEISETLSKILSPLPDKGEKAFTVLTEKNILKIEIPKKKADLRGIVTEIPYAVNVDSGMTSEFRKLFSKEPYKNSWEIEFPRIGYSGKMEIELRDGESFLAWTKRKYKDKTRFPARIKAAATAMKIEGLRGEFQIFAEGKSVKIGAKKS
jgi:superfamily II DNA or RNA helicase/predicted house-cleaning noncanonical NTP pyrophosphatase (MazG superfamily)/HKD family nuclease